MVIIVRIKKEEGRRKKEEGRRKKLESFLINEASIIPIPKNNAILPMELQLLSNNNG
ncbi:MULTISPECIES: hypothetical protein [Okeania]|uniref:hypothetical protein n=1 Tax=Okeania TaxID=1458928 RepID=UPI001374DC57|nr:MULTISPECIES: hypothetical protein [Okeania]NET13062.1 hypothetical protein [Okeania sp. SIO1H6]NES76421.1 hypothetical protein [Okeania sp. SIO1H4]NES88370.1 hypothetical protein [Okeania sp. SIO2B9]NET21798.1 hypothetical protein [Okeania sp. SIO1H5]NET78773.1 hypothetical protein [Okeania sp. SIO1F9]